MKMKELHFVKVCPFSLMQTDFLKFFCHKSDNLRHGSDCQWPSLRIYRKHIEGLQILTSDYQEKYMWLFLEIYLLELVTTNVLYLQTIHFSDLYRCCSINFDYCGRCQHKILASCSCLVNPLNL